MYSSGALKIFVAAAAAAESLKEKAKTGWNSVYHQNWWKFWFGSQLFRFVKFSFPVTCLMMPYYAKTGRSCPHSSPDFMVNSNNIQKFNFQSLKPECQTLNFHCKSLNSSRQSLNLCCSVSEVFLHFAWYHIWLTFLHKEKSLLFWRIH